MAVADTSHGGALGYGHGQVFTQYRPCTCDSGCKSSCECKRNGIFCEKYCKCTGCAHSKCSNHFAGCKCVKGACRTRACPCFAAQRECDPDKCKHCMTTASTVNERRIDRLSAPPPPLCAFGTRYEGSPAIAEPSSQAKASRPKPKRSAWRQVSSRCETHTHTHAPTQMHARWQINTVATGSADVMMLPSLLMLI